MGHIYLNDSSESKLQIFPIYSIRILNTLERIEKNEFDNFLSIENSNGTYREDL